MRYRYYFSSFWFILRARSASKITKTIYSTHTHCVNRVITFLAVIYARNNVLMGFSICAQFVQYPHSLFELLQSSITAQNVITLIIAPLALRVYAFCLVTLRNSIVVSHTTVILSCYFMMLFYHVILSCYLYKFLKI